MRPTLVADANSNNKRNNNGNCSTKIGKHMGESKAVANHDQDMIHELGKRIDAVWRFDQ